MIDHNNPDPEISKGRLERDDTFELFYQLIGRIIAKHENLEKMTTMCIRFLLKDILHYRCKWEGSESSKKAHTALFNPIQVALQDSDSITYTKVFCALLEEWATLLAEADKSARFSKEEVDILREILEFESRVRNCVAHSSFEYPMFLQKNIKAHEQLIAVLKDGRRKTGGFYRVSVHDREDFIDFCAFQNRLSKFIEDFTGMCFEEMLCIVHDGGDVVEGYINSFVHVEIKDLYEWKKRIKILNPHSERGEDAVIDGLW